MLELFLNALALDTNSFIELGTSVVTTQAITEILGRVVREKRPLEDSDLSFPSCHAAAAFSGATFIYKKFGYRLGIPAFGLASLVAASRVIGKRKPPLSRRCCKRLPCNCYEHRFCVPHLKKRKHSANNSPTDSFSLLRPSIQY